jgi:hypothetical protein
MHAAQCERLDCNLVLRIFKAGSAATGGMPKMAFVTYIYQSKGPPERVWLLMADRYACSPEARQQDATTDELCRCAVTNCNS